MIPFAVVDTLWRSYYYQAVVRLGHVSGGPCVVGDLGCLFNWWWEGSGWWEFYYLVDPPYYWSDLMQGLYWVGVAFVLLWLLAPLMLLAVRIYRTHQRAQWSGWHDKHADVQHSRWRQTDKWTAEALT